MAARRLLRSVATLSALALVAACGLVFAIDGISNANLYSPPPSRGTFAVVPAYGDPFVAPKIERMIAFILQRHGLEPAPSTPDVYVIYGFDVVPAGEISSAVTFVRTTAQTTTFIGNQAFTTGGRAQANTVVDTTRLFQKTVAILLVDARTRNKLWEGSTNETGWCNQIVVTAPHILSLMFSSFPGDATNQRKMVAKSDRVANEIKAIFPPQTNWGCR